MNAGVSHGKIDTLFAVRHERVISHMASKYV